MEVATIEDKMHLAKEKARVDAVYYATLKSAEAEKLRLTPQYLELVRLQVRSTPLLHSFLDRKSGA